MSLTLRSISQYTTDANTAIRRHRERFEKISNQMSSKSGVAMSLPSDHTLADVATFFEAHTNIAEANHFHRKEMISAHKHLSPEACEAVTIKIQLFNSMIDLIKKSATSGIFQKEYEKKVSFRNN